MCVYIYIYIYIYMFVCVHMMICTFGFMFHFGIQICLCMCVYSHIHTLKYTYLHRIKREIIKGYILSCICLELSKFSNLCVYERLFGVPTKKANGLASATIIYKKKGSKRNLGSTQYIAKLANKQMVAYLFSTVVNTWSVLFLSQTKAFCLTCKPFQGLETYIANFTHTYTLHISAFKAFIHRHAHQHPVFWAPLLLLSHSQTSTQCRSRACHVSI
jgi:hypothetical protein